METTPFIQHCDSILKLSNVDESLKLIDGLFQQLQIGDESNQPIETTRDDESNPIETTNNESNPIETTRDDESNPIETTGDDDSNVDTTMNDTMTHNDIKENQDDSNPNNTGDDSNPSTTHTDSNRSTTRDESKMNATTEYWRQRLGTSEFDDHFVINLHLVSAIATRIEKHVDDRIESIKQFVWKKVKQQQDPNSLFLEEYTYHVFAQMSINICNIYSRQANWLYRTLYYADIDYLQENSHGLINYFGIESSYTPDGSILTFLQNTDLYEFGSANEHWFINHFHHCLQQHHRDYDIFIDPLYLMRVESGTLSGWLKSERNMSRTIERMIKKRHDLSIAFMTGTLFSLYFAVEMYYDVLDLENKQSIDRNMMPPHHFCIVIKICIAIWYAISIKIMRIHSMRSREGFLLHLTSDFHWIRPYLCEAIGRILWLTDIRLIWNNTTPYNIIFGQIWKDKVPFKIRYFDSLPRIKSSTWSETIAGMYFPLAMDILNHPKCTKIWRAFDGLDAVKAFDKDFMKKRNSTSFYCQIYSILKMNLSDWIKTPNNPVLIPWVNERFIDDFNDAKLIQFSYIKYNNHSDKKQPTFDVPEHSPEQEREIKAFEDDEESNRNQATSQTTDLRMASDGIFRYISELSSEDGAQTTDHITHPANAIAQSGHRYSAFIRNQIIEHGDEVTSTNGDESPLTNNDKQEMDDDGDQEMDVPLNHSEESDEESEEEEMDVPLNHSEEDEMDPPFNHQKESDEESEEDEMDPPFNRQNELEDESEEDEIDPPHNESNDDDDDVALPVKDLGGRLRGTTQTKLAEAIKNELDAIANNIVWDPADKAFSIDFDDALFYAPPLLFAVNEKTQSAIIRRILDLLQPLRGILLGLFTDSIRASLVKIEKTWLVDTQVHEINSFMDNEFVNWRRKVIKKNEIPKKWIPKTRGECHHFCSSIPIANHFMDNFALCWAQIKDYLNFNASSYESPEKVTKMNLFVYSILQLMYLFMFSQGWYSKKNKDSRDDKATNSLHQNYVYSRKYHHDKEPAGFSWHNHEHAIKHMMNNLFWFIIQPNTNYFVMNHSKEMQCAVSRFVEKTSIGYDFMQQVYEELDTFHKIGMIHQRDRRLNSKNTLNLGLIYIEIKILVEWVNMMISKHYPNGCKYTDAQFKTYNRGRKTKLDPSQVKKKTMKEIWELVLMYTVTRRKNTTSKNVIGAFVRSWFGKDSNFITRIKSGLMNNRKYTYDQDAIIEFRNTLDDGKTPARSNAHSSPLISSLTKQWQQIHRDDEPIHTINTNSAPLQDHNHNRKSNTNNTPDQPKVSKKKSRKKKKNKDASKEEEKKKKKNKKNKDASKEEEKKKKKNKKNKDASKEEKKKSRKKARKEQKKRDKKLAKKDKIKGRKTKKKEERKNKIRLNLAKNSSQKQMAPTPIKLESTTSNGSIVKPLPKISKSTKRKKKSLTPAKRKASQSIPMKVNPYKKPRIQ
eukprot:175069_1